MKLRAMETPLETLKIAVGSRVRSFRRAADISQEDLAAKIKRSTAALSNIERGQSLPPLDTLLTIADALNVPMYEFFSDFQLAKTQKRAELDAELRVLISEFSEEQASTAARVLKAL